MAKYKALKDVPPEIKAGDIVEFKKPLVPSYKGLFERYVAPKDDEEDDKDLITNPDRNALKARATELEINFASNIPTDRLIELIKEAEEKSADPDNSSDGEDKDDEDKDEDDKSDEKETEE